MVQNYGLGRGLSSLIPRKKINSQEKNEKEEKITEEFAFRSLSDEHSNGQRKNNEAGGNTGILEMDIDRIVANPYQPRIEFDKVKLQELAQSIKEHGIIQPLVVTENDEEYELVAGERRLQASKLAGLKKVPIIIKNIKAKEKLELAIVENIQRHNLSPIEEAKAYEQLMKEFKMTQEEVAKKMGKNRSVVANKLRLLNLPVEAIKALNENKITEGHAKSILSLKNIEKQIAFLNLIIKNQLTVRQAEDKTKEFITVRSHKRVVNVDPEIRNLEEKFSSVLGTKVKVKKTGGKGGKIIIDYYSKEELNKIVDKLVK